MPHRTFLFISPATSAPGRSEFGQGTGDIVLEGVQCSGTESNLFDCPHNALNVHDCVHFEDAGAVCSGIHIL